MGKFTKLEEHAEALKNIGIPLFLDVSLPDEKGLFGASPCHTLPLSSRVEWNAEVQHYSGGIAYDIENSSSESDKEEEKDTLKPVEPKTPAVFLKRSQVSDKRIASMRFNRLNPDRKRSNSFSHAKGKATS